MSPRPIVGLVSSFDEGLLLRSCVESLARCCERVFVLEGPIGEALKPTEEFPKRLPGNVLVRRGGPWASDAAKRTELVKWAQASRQTAARGRPWDAWAVVLDGDEILWAAELLPEYLRRCEDEEEGAMRLRLVEAGDDVVVYE
ncbi:MAG TPA: hypothetical protein VIJ60_10465, partial [Acidimicrobiales bacterium]